MKTIIPVVCIAFIGFNVFILFAVIIMWLVKFSREVAKSWKAWKAHPCTNSEEERGFVVRMELAKHILIVTLLITLIVFIPIMGFHNANVLASYEAERNVKKVGECDIYPNTWIWDRVNDSNILSNSEWQPFGILPLISFELVVLQLITSQSNKSKRLFTWQVKVTAIFAFVEFIAIFALNIFIETLFIGHILFVLLAQIHLIIIDVCLIWIYLLMRKQIRDLSHLKSREYYASLRYKQHYQCFLIPMVSLLQIMVGIEIVFVVSIIVDTFKLNSCWIKEKYSFIHFDSTEVAGDWTNQDYSEWLTGVNIFRQSLGLFVVWYLLVAQCVYSFKEWRREKCLKRSPNDCVMQDSNDIEVPLMGKEDKLNY